MLEIGLFIAVLVYAFTLPGRIERVKSGNVPAKYAAEPARYEKRVRSESLVLMICSIVWAVKDLIQLLFLRDAEELGGAAVFVWAFVLGWVALAAGLHVVRRPLAA
jgi:hypothetical protein